MRGLIASIVIAAVLTFNARTARAQETDWYGWKLLTADGISTAVVLGGLKGPDKAMPIFIVTGVLGLVFAPPILHAIEDDVSTGTAFASLGLRVGLPAVGGLTLGLLMGRNPGGAHGNIWGGIFGGLLGASLGMVVAIAIDDFALARKDTGPGASPRILRLTFSF